MITSLMCGQRDCDWKGSDEDDAVRPTDNFVYNP